jgi:hypothetical protein
MKREDYAKQQGDWELIKTLNQHEGFKVFIERLEEVKADYKERLASLLDSILHSDGAEDKEKYKNLRIELLGVEAAIAIYADIRNTAQDNAQSLKDFGDAIFEGEGPPEHNV